ncbi:MAG: 6-phosphofructokinase [Betaproteobacteria bacterium AqS2]|uniref:Pyrophosphate--fructose 6-phosphate 1-phosphotransferase n=1 Tax=Candidatus Amphirhobacter heronislandensis TaxID=1732024 RepID=A0A930UFI2_9GAMM|nr:6-phosphofructokinase [Betaproteobacteria bacterium AqS2]
MPDAPNLLYAQSGGVTSVINATAWGVATAAAASPKVGRVYAGRNGILGVLAEELIDVTAEDKREIAKLRHTPGGAFGSCRLKLTDPAKDSRSFERIAEVFKAHRIGYFLYNGGNDSQDTTNKVAEFCRARGVDVRCVGIPKTVDNDLAATDCCPGFGSVAKYVAATVAETALDVESMARTSTKLFILEVMGRHAGWIAAAGGLPYPAAGPVILALPEVPHKRFFAAVKAKIAKHGYCVVVASEGLADAKGRHLSERGTKDSFAHAQLGGVAAVLAERAKAKLGVKYHWALADYMQRAARHLSSQVDLDQAAKVGQAAVAYATAGKTQVMPAIVRTSDRPYRWTVKPVPLQEVANKERKLPKGYVTADGYYITAACRRYLQPLIAGEAPQPYRDGLPVHARLRRRAVRKKLPAFRV